MLEVAARRLPAMASETQYDAIMGELDELDLEEEAAQGREEARGVEETPSQEVTMKELRRAADADLPSPEAEAAAGDKARESAPVASDTSAPATPQAATARPRAGEIFLTIHQYQTTN